MLWQCSVDERHRSARGVEGAIAVPGAETDFACLRGLASKLGEPLDSCDALLASNATALRPPQAGLAVALFTEALVTTFFGTPVAISASAALSGTFSVGIFRENIVHSVSWRRDETAWSNGWQRVIHTR